MRQKLLTLKLSESKVSPMQLKSCQEKPAMPFRQAAQLWLESKQFPKTINGRHKYKALRTLRDYAEYIRDLDLFFGDMQLVEISSAKIKQYQAEAAQSVGPNKIEQRLSLLRWVLQSHNAWTEELDSYPRLVREESEIPRALTQEQQDEFIRAGAQSACHSLMYCYSLIALETTASKYEMLALRLCDVNRGDGMIYVKWGKNKHRVRSLPLTVAHDDRGNLKPGCGQWAIAQLIRRAQELGSFREEHFLFPAMARRNLYNPEKHVTECGLQKHWDALRHTAKAPWFHLNALRHTGLTRYAENGMPIEGLMALAGHISQKMTRHYIQIRAQALRRIQAEALSRTTTAPRKPMQPVRDVGGESWAYAL